MKVIQHMIPFSIVLGDLTREITPSDTDVRYRYIDGDSPSKYLTRPAIKFDMEPKVMYTNFVRGGI